MRRIVVAVVAVLGMSLAVGTANAATPPDLFVDNAMTNCSDSGPGTQAQPFCTVQHAADVVVAGQTVQIPEGVYEESVTITHSGSPGAPITFNGSSSRTFGQALIAGSPTAIALSGVHDVQISGLALAGTQAMTVTDSSSITIDSMEISVGGSSAPAAAGISLSGRTSDVTVSRNVVNGGFGNGGVFVGAGVTGAVVTTNVLNENSPANVVVVNAPGTIVTANTMLSRCKADVEITDASTGSVVENNIAREAVATTGSCPALMAVDSSSASGTTLDYNVVWAQGRGGLYQWAGTSFDTPAELSAATGEGAHDIAADPMDTAAQTGFNQDVSLLEGSPAIDSADANAPGELSTDFLGHGRADDLATPNTGTGSGIVDRGALELQDPFQFSVVDTSFLEAPGPADITVTADPFNPWGEPTRYTFSFGDGSPNVTTTSTTAPAITHTYTGSPQTFEISVSAVTADGIQGTGATSFELTPNEPLRATLNTSQVGVLLASAQVTETGSFAVFDSGTSVDFGDGTPPEIGGETPNHTYAKPGTYTVTATVTDQDGNTTTASKTITIASAYLPVDPVRVLDTRNGTGAPAAHVGAGGVVTLHLAGTNGLPATGVTAVVLNLTATAPTTSGFLVAYPDGTLQSTASSLNFTPGQTVPNLVTVPLGADGSVDIANSAGDVDIVADLQGFYANTGSSSSDALLLRADPPSRLLDTRSDGGPLTAGQVRRLDVPVDGAAILNVTVTNPSTSGFITVWPDDRTKPGTSNLNYVAGQTTSNMVVVPVNNGTIDIADSAGTANVVIDDESDFLSFDPPTFGFTPAGPTRLLDTRTTGGPIGAGATRTLHITGVPADVRAVALNVTVTDPTTAGFLTVFPSQGSQPTSSNLNFTAGETVANQVIVPVGPDGSIELFNKNGTTDAIVDLAGYYQD